MVLTDLRTSTYVPRKLLDTTMLIGADLNKSCTCIVTCMLSHNTHPIIEYLPMYTAD